VKQVLSWRTRGQATLKRAGGDADDKSKIILAKAGLKAHYGLNRGEQNDWIVKQFLER